MTKRVIGITGGVGSGKSLVLKLLAERWGAEVIQADQVARELEEPGQPGLSLLLEKFGPDILDGAGALNRAAFAQRIFSDPAALSAVNGLIHPLVYREISRRTTASGRALVAVEAALFSPENKRELCGELWFVDADDETRIRRLMQNRGYSRKKCLDMMKNQPAREAFLAIADQVIDNSRTPGEVLLQLTELLGGPVR